jgi:Ni,Fe-hydrogenase III large subunit
MALAEVARHPVAAWRARVVEEVARGGRIAALFGHPEGGRLRLFAVLAHPDAAAFSVDSADVGERYPALTPDCTQAHWFEREIAEVWGVVPEGHPWLKPIRFTGGGLPGVPESFRVEGEEIHEVAVGPVHAGVIEPGHFRFQCYGERVLHLEISLGYQHRGVERALAGGPTKRSIHYAETLAGDTTIGHATAYAQVLESLSRCQVPPRAEALRAVALELERLANHCGDLGALAGDVGYLPTASYCGRIRGDYLNASALLCGSRFGRGMVRPGGVGFDVDQARAEDLLGRIEGALAHARGAANLLWESPSVLARFEGTGTVPREIALDLGLVGVAARACGIPRDARLEFPSGLYRFFQVPVSTWSTGDVFARAYVRWLEMQQSTAFLREVLRALPAGAVRAEVGALAPERIAVSMVEGWRGEICHVALSDAHGRLAAYKVVDPSFRNWFGLAMALRNQEISDFPLCNKSFNLSYCGHDL